MSFVPNTALVTGASAGIGAAFARRLARGGCDVVLVARSVDRITELANELERSYSVRAWPIPCDLSEIGAPGRLFERTRDLGLDVDLLVNNAGAMIVGRLCELSWAEHEPNIRLMAIAPSELMHTYLGPMLHAGRGAVLNVLSMSVDWPASPGNTFYAAAKTFLLKVTRSAAAEYAGRGVVITAILPGVTDTEMINTQRIRALLRRVPKGFVASADDVARVGLRTVGNGDGPGYVRRLDALGGVVLDRIAPRNITARAFARWTLSKEAVGDV